MWQCFVFAYYLSHLSLTISIFEDDAHCVSSQQLVVVNNPQRFHFRVHVLTPLHTGREIEKLEVEFFLLFYAVFWLKLLQQQFNNINIKMFVYKIFHINIRTRSVFETPFIFSNKSDSSYNSSIKRREIKSLISSTWNQLCYWRAVLQSLAPNLTEYNRTSLVVSCLNMPTILCEELYVKSVVCPHISINIQHTNVCLYNHPSNYNWLGL